MELYHLRWGIKTSFRTLKYAIGMTSFHAKKEESIKQEIFARLMMFNFCSRIANSIIVEQKDDNTYSYKVNFTQAIHICFAYLKKQLKIDIRDLRKRYIEPVRPGREDERKIKPKSAVFFIYRVAWYPSRERDKAPLRFIEQTQLIHKLHQITQQKKDHSPWKLWSLLQHRNWFKTVVLNLTWAFKQATIRDDKPALT